ncbi:MAG: hypothetical protein ACREQ9_02855 [Candidatus Binatia bacterium]
MLAFRVKRREAGGAPAFGAAPDHPQPPEVPLSRIPVLVIAAAVLGAPLLAAEPPLPPQFTADATTRMGSGEVIRSKVYSSGRRLRTETDAGAQTVTSILDLRDRKMWMIMPPPLGCIEQAMGQEFASPMTAPPRESEELLGTETIDGHPCRKYRTVTTVRGKKYVMYEWRATDLQDLVIRSTGDDGKFEMRYTNVRLGASEPALFEVPKDCRPLQGPFPGIRR